MNERDVQLLQEAISEKFLPIVFDNHGISGSSADDGKTGKYGIHFIVMHKVVSENGQIIYTYGDYGETTDDSKNKKEFLSGVKAYWIPVKRKLRTK